MYGLVDSDFPHLLPTMSDGNQVTDILGRTPTEEEILKQEVNVDTPFGKFRFLAKGPYTSSEAHDCSKRSQKVVKTNEK